MNPLNPEKYTKIRNYLRAAGIVTTMMGLGLLIIGIVSFFYAFGGGGPPKYFWCSMLGLPVLFAGGVMLQFGYLGAVARFASSQALPVAKEATDYMAEETKGAVRTMAKAVGEGLVEGMEQARRASKHTDKD
jgi:hypothetical protein